MLVYRTNPNLTGGDPYLTHKTDKGWELETASNNSTPKSPGCLRWMGRVIFVDRPVLRRGDRTSVPIVNGDWSLPCNSDYHQHRPDEDAPFLTADGAALYFASKGHLTMAATCFAAIVNEPDV